MPISASPNADIEAMWESEGKSRLRQHTRSRHACETDGIEETFERPSYAKACHRFGLTPGIVLDVRRNWNFGDKSERDMILEQFEWKKPILLIGADRGSPKCVNTEHVKFLNELYKKQRDRGG